MNVFTAQCLIDKRDFVMSLHSGVPVHVPRKSEQLLMVLLDADDHTSTGTAAVDSVRVRTS